MASFPKVLITGIEGFTGIHLSEYLRLEGFSIYGMSYFPSDDARTFMCDITQLQQVKSIIHNISPDYIIHLAGISFVAHNNVQGIYSTNVQGTINLLDACVELDKKPEKIILASSATVYGNQNSEILVEDMCPIPNSHYANSKLAMENMARNYFETLNIMIVRPFNYTGRGQAQHFVIPKIVHHFREKKSEIELGNINVFREFNDVRYICSLYHQMMLSNHKNDIVNFCSGNTVSLTVVIDTLKELTGQQIDVKVKPQFVRVNEIHSLSGSTSKLYKILGEIPQEDTLLKLLRNML